MWRGSSINFSLFYWVDLAKIDFFNGTSVGVMAIKKAFDQAGLDLPIRGLNDLEPDENVALIEALDS